MAKKKMKIRSWMDGDKAKVKAIVFHPMETGLRKDKTSGKIIPGNYITEVNCLHNDNNVLTCFWGPGVSKNPFLAFSFKGAKSGDSLKISWVDNNGNKGSGESKIK